MSASPSTVQHIHDHLGQAEFELRVTSNFDCLQGTPAHDAVRAALARVDEARNWIRQNLAEKNFVAVAHQPVEQTPAERHRQVQRRMARLAP